MSSVIRAESTKVEFSLIRVSYQEGICLIRSDLHQQLRWTLKPVLGQGRCCDQIEKV